MINKNPSIIKVALRAIHISQERVNLVQFKPMLRVLSDTTLKSQEQSLKFLKALKFLYKFKFDLKSFIFYVIVSNQALQRSKNMNSCGQFSFNFMLIVKKIRFLVE